MPRIGLAARQRFLDQPDALDRLDAGADVVAVAGADREDQRIEDDVLGLDAVFFGQQFERALARSAACAARVTACACCLSSSMQPTTSAAP